MVARRFSLLTLLTVFCASSPALAEEPAPTKDFVAKLHLSPPLATHSFNVDGSESVTLGGGSLALEMYEIAFIEGGANAMIVGINSPAMPDAYAWFGFAPVIVDGREADGEGSLLQLEGVVGYRYYVTENEVSESLFVRDANHNLAFGLGLEQTTWLAPHFGVNFRALVTASIPLLVDRTQRQPNPNAPEELSLLVSVMPSFGAVF